jgi:hypothetical protein
MSENPSVNADLLDELACLTAQLDQAKARMSDVMRRQPTLHRTPPAAVDELVELERWMRSLKRRAELS